MIDGTTRITIQRVRGQRVTVSIDAPDHVSILRGEIAFELHEDKAEVEKSVDDPAEIRFPREVCLG